LLVAISLLRSGVFSGLDADYKLLTLPEHAASCEHDRAVPPGSHPTQTASDRGSNRLL
jgi:hypothetical protein